MVMYSHIHKKEKPDYSSSSSNKLCDTLTNCQLDLGSPCMIPKKGSTMDPRCLLAPQRAANLKCDVIRDT